MSGVVFGGLCPCGGGPMGHQPCALIAPVDHDENMRPYYVHQGPPSPLPKPRLWPELLRLFRAHWRQTGGGVCCDSENTLRRYRSWCLRSFVAGLAVNDHKWEALI